MEMKKFLLKISLFSVLLVLSVIVLLLFNFYVVSNQYLYIYTGSILDKMDRLKSINGPKIILTGDSNLAFGINSEAIEKELNMQVVNLGLHGDFDNIFSENMAKENINEGDIIVLSHTKYDTDGLINDYSLAWSTIEKHTELYKLIDTKDYKNMFLSMPQYIKDSTIKWIEKSGNKHPTGQYSRDAFNKYGDVINKTIHTKTSELFKQGNITVPKISEETIKRLNNLNDYVKSKGAYLVLAANPIAYGEYTPSKDAYDAFEKQIREQLNFDVISHFSDYFIPYERFLDSKNHLDKEGADIRTKQLIKDLKSWKKSNYMNKY